MKKLFSLEYFKYAEITTEVLEDKDQINEIIVTNSNQFEKLYEYKLYSYKVKIPAATYNDFIEHELNVCDTLQDNCTLFQYEYIKENAGSEASKIYTDTVADIENEILFMSRWREYLTNMRNVPHANALSESTSPVNLPKLKWKGTAPQFAYLIHELIEKGYLEKPTPHFRKDAHLYMQVFDINTTESDLANEIDIYNNRLPPANKKDLK